MSLTSCIIRRTFSTTSICSRKKNFTKFMLYNKRGPRDFKERQKTDPYPAIPVDNRGVREIGYKEDDRFILIPERIPELIVPNLDGCELKPYVSYRVLDVHQSEFTAQDLFNVVYAKKIIKDYNENKLDDNGNSTEPNDYELLTREEAKNRALKTGSDLFTENDVHLDNQQQK